MVVYLEEQYIAMRDLELSYEELFPLDTTKSKKGKLVALQQTNLDPVSGPSVIPSNTIRPKEPLEKRQEKKKNTETLQEEETEENKLDLSGLEFILDN